MRILLINPNRYHQPPVPPLGLEYLQCALQPSGHESRILDLCFERDCRKALAEAVAKFAPRVAGVTVRNIDTTLYQNNLFFLDEIKQVVRQLKQLGVPSLLGGAGFSFNPAGVLSYLGASWGIRGPGEIALPGFLDTLENGQPPEGTILNGWSLGADPGLDTTGRGKYVDYPAYLKKGGIGGFETQKGCMGNCPYCLEASGHVIFRQPQKIIRELEELVGQGVTEFHLCDSEFNQDLDYCHEFLENLIGARIQMHWALYMRSTPYDEKLFRMLAKSGGNLVTLSVPSGGNSLKHAARFRRFTERYGIRLAVDYICGFPGQGAEKVREDVEKLRRIRPDTVGLTNFIRLFPASGLTARIQADPDSSRFLCGELEDNPGLIRPVFYSGISTDALKEIVGEDPLFKIEGFERTTNYERLRTAPP